MNRYLIPFLCVVFFACGKQSTSQESYKTNNELEKAYFASGCFWCVEAIFESIEGVEEAVSGYAGGTQKNPTYEQVGYGLTDHAETVKVYYDPSKVSFETLVRAFYGSHDPTTLNKQGPDRGKQYRSIAFYSNDEEKKSIDSITEELNKSTFNNQIVTQIQKLDIFYQAEDYHQNYEKLNPSNPYVKSVSIPRLNRFKKKFPHILKKDH